MRYLTVAALLMGGVMSSVHAQTTLDHPTGELQLHDFDSGLRPNSLDHPAIVYQNLVRLEDAAWVRLYFGEVELGEGSFVRVTSVLDGEIQQLDADALIMWNNTSAYFNGDSVKVELVAGPATQRNRITLAQVAREIVRRQALGGSGQCGICGSTDDRVPSDQDWTSRLLPAGCTASIFHEDSCLVSAGHCIGGSMVVQFNVPNSSSNCNINNPPVADQFPVLTTEFSNGGPGNDWAVMTSGTNNQGQTAYERYGQLRPISETVASSGQAVDLTGYGVDLTCTMSQTQQTASGTLNSVGNLMYTFSVDLRGGNSGSSLIRNDEIIGIATHCPCPNIATRIDHDDFTEARDLMCPPPELGVTTVPFYDPFTNISLNETLWTGITWADTSTRGINEPSAPRSLNLNGNVVGGDEIRSAVIDTSGQADLVLSYWYEAGGVDDAPEVGDNLIVEYQNSSQQWVQLNQHLGNGAIMNNYIQVTLTLPAAAKHANFRLRFRCLSAEELGNDDWFVDDVCIGSTAFCAAPFECMVSADCEDAIACTDDLCSAGLCQYTANNVLCDDGMPCTTDTCSPFGGCQHLPNNASCNDGVACTNDFCNVFSGCQSVVNDSNCDDGDACTDDVCNALSGCENPSNGVCPSGVGLAAADVTDALAESLDLSVCRVYATFDAPTYNLLSVGFSDISTDDPDGFYQNAFVGDTAPNVALCGVFPEACLDSFVTVGLSTNDGNDATALDGDWSSSLFNTSGSTTGGWFNANPLNSQGHPDGQGQVLIAQFTVTQGYEVSGSLTVYFNDGSVPAPLSFVCAGSCPADLNEDGTVDAADLAGLLGAWGVNPGHEADFNDDGTIDAADLATLLGAWGPC